MSGRKKPLSIDDKKKKLLELFHETSDFWTLKDLEKQAPKQKGIVQNTVKDVLEQLMSDGLVTQEKIGTSNYFWSFPAAANATKKRRLADLIISVQKAKDRKLDLDQKIIEAEAGREKSDEREELQSTLDAQEAKYKELNKELMHFRDCDPATLELKEKAMAVAKDAANRWTDNIFILQSYCRQFFNMSTEDFCRQFEIPEDLDNIE